MKEDYKLEIEKRLTKMETTLDKISTNELPHLQSISEKILWWIIGGFTSVFIAVAVHGVITYLQIK